MTPPDAQGPAAARAEWLTSKRWGQSHLIRSDSWARFIGSTTETYRSTACGRTVRFERLEPEPIGIDTQGRCPICRRHAAEFGADSSV